MKTKYQQNKYQASPSPLLLALIQRFIDIHYPQSQQVKMNQTYIHPMLANPLNANQTTNRG
jgi:hypothetical protein